MEKGIEEKIILKLGKEDEHVNISPIVLSRELKEEARRGRNSEDTGVINNMQTRGTER